MNDWSWLKASLPSSRGGINLCSAVLHAPAALIASSHSSKSLVEDILGFSPGPSPYMNAAIVAIAAVAVRPHWTSLDEVDVPVRQGVLLHAIDEALYQNLLSTAPSIRSRALALSSGLPHAGDWLNVVPSSPLGLHLHDKKFRSYLCYLLGPWGSPYTVLHTLVLSVGESLTHLEIIRLGVEKTETVSPAIMLSGMCSSVWLGLRLWLPLKRLLAWCLARAPDQQTSFSLPGVGVAPQPWMFTSFHRSSGRP